MSAKLRNFMNFSFDKKEKKIGKNTLISNGTCDRKFISVLTFFSPSVNLLMAISFDDLKALTQHNEINHSNFFFGVGYSRLHIREF